MDALESLVLRARDGDADAFAVLVRRFQDMAVGYGYSVLRDFHLAEDAAQEAFFEAYRNLSKLREPAAFAGWFRQIVFKQCDRITRRKRVPTVSLEGIREPASLDRENDMKDEVLDAVDNLPEHERVVMLLFYVTGYSLEEVGTSLAVPISTVKGRLHSARNRLREMLFDRVEQELRARRPSRSEVFAEAVVDLLTAARTGDIARVKALLQANPRLLVARDPMGNTALIIAVNSGHQELAQLLLESGVRPGIHEAAAIGDTERVRALLDEHLEPLDSYSPEGFPPLALAAHFGHLPTVRLLLEYGADVNRVARHHLEVTPLHAALFGQQVEVALFLIRNGANVRQARAGKGWRRDGWTPLHYAAGLGFRELVGPLLERGADVSSVDAEGRTALQVATETRHEEIAELLRDEGAK